MENKKLVGLRPISIAEEQTINTAKKMCFVANNEIIPLMQELGQSVTFEAVCVALKSREKIIADAVAQTLSLPEYSKQPQLLKDAVAKLRREEVEEIMRTHGTTTIHTPEAEAFCLLSADGVMTLDEEAINKRRQVWAVGDEECAIFEAYGQVVEALDKLFPKGLPSVERLSFLFELSHIGGRKIAINPAQWRSILTEAQMRR